MDFRIGDLAFVKRGMRQINLRTAPSLSAPANQTVLWSGAPLGKVVEISGNFCRFDFQKGSKYVWCAVGNLEPELLTGEDIYAFPGRAGRAYLDVGLKQVALPKLPEVVGSVQRVVRTGSQKSVVLVRSKTSNVPWYVSKDTVIGSRQIVAGLARAGEIDKGLFTTALALQKQINGLKAKGLNTSVPQARLDAIMNAAKVRQNKLAALAKDDGLQLVTESATGVNGIGALPIWLVATLVVGCIMGIAFVSVATYRYFIAEKPHQAAEFDQKRLNKLKADLKGATTQEDIDRIVDGFKADVNDYGNEQFEKGADSEKKGFFEKIFSGTQTVVWVLGGYIFYKEIIVPALPARRAKTTSK